MYQFKNYLSFAIKMDNDFYESYRKLGLNIAYYRKDRGYTQERLAELLDVDRTTVSKIEIAGSGVSLDVIFKFCKLLDVPIHKLFEFRD